MMDLLNKNWILVTLMYYYVHVVHIDAQKTNFVPQEKTCFNQEHQERLLDNFRSMQLSIKESFNARMNDLEANIKSLQLLSSSFNDRFTALEDKISLQDEERIKSQQLLNSSFSARIAALEDQISLQEGEIEKLKPTPQNMIFDEKKSWINARKECLSFGGDLVSMATNAELRTIYNKFIQKGIDLTRKCSDGVDAGIWTSGHKDNRGNWFWGNSEKNISSSLWIVGEPNNSRGKEKCAYIRNEENGLNDVECEKRLCYACKIYLLNLL